MTKGQTNEIEKPGLEADTDTVSRYERDSFEGAMGSFAKRFESDDEDTPAFHPRAAGDEPAAPVAPPTELPEATPVESEKVEEETPKAEETPQEQDPPKDTSEPAPSNDSEDSEKADPAPESSHVAELDTVIRYRHNHEDKEMDLRPFLTDPEKYPDLVTLIQKGVDYDRQRGLADEQRTAAEASVQRLQQFTEFSEKQGWIKRNALTQQFEVVQQRTAAAQATAQQHAEAANKGQQAVQAQAQQVQTPDQQQRTARTAELSRKMNEEGLLPGEIQEFVSLETQRGLDQFRAEMTADSQRAAHQQQQVDDRDQMARNVEAAKNAVGKRQEALRSLYTDPTTGQVDEYNYGRVREAAWARVLNGGTVPDALTAMDADARAYHTRAQAFLSKMAEQRGGRPTSAPVHSPAPGGAASGAGRPKRSTGIDLDAPPGRDGLAEAMERWGREADRNG